MEEKKEEEEICGVSVERNPQIRLSTFFFFYVDVCVWSESV